MADETKFKLSTTNTWVISDEKGNTIKSGGGNPERPTIAFKLMASGVTGTMYANEAPLLIRLLELTIEHTDSTPTEVELE